LIPKSKSNSNFTDNAYSTDRLASFVVNNSGNEAENLTIVTLRQLKRSHQMFVSFEMGYLGVIKYYDEKYILDYLFDDFLQIYYIFLTDRSLLNLLFLHTISFK
jgi:hypothetical protein